jgi:tRNA nucleotidyltransferase/poly(A) polymerase
MLEKWLIAEKIIKTLNKNGFEAYVVGGAVRDMLLKIECKDIDITTNAPINKIEEIFDGYKLHNLNKNFGVINIDGIDVAHYRQDFYSGLSDKNVKVILLNNLEEDLSRRDFTINAMAYDITNKKIIDLFDGISDLKRKEINFVKNPDERIYEDPNRIFRAFRFLAKINGTFGEKTKQSIIKNYSLVKYVKQERIKEEIRKLLSSTKKSSIFFNSLQEVGILQYIFPQLSAGWEHPHGPHHKEDIFQHNMLVGDNLSTKNWLLKLSGYLHDIGKPISAKINPRTDDFMFTGHSSAGADEVYKNLRFLKFSNEETTYVTTMIKIHMKSILSATPKSIRKILVILKENNMENCYKDLIRLRCADKAGNLLHSNKYSLREIRTMLLKFKEELNREGPKNPFSKLEVNGNDVMEICGIRPGPRVGFILNQLYKLVCYNQNLNEKSKLTRIMKSINSKKIVVKIKESNDLELEEI